ncbi:MAG: hypothetical protein RR461_05155 [Angelakisella sp.]
MDRQGKKPMSRRESMNRHHTIRRTGDYTPKRRLSTFAMFLLFLVSVMAITALNNRGAGSPLVPPPSMEAGTSAPISQPSPDQTSPTREQLFTIAGIMAEGRWGSETLDSCILLAKGFAASGDTNAAAYMELLVAGSAPDAASETLIAALTTDQDDAKNCGLALESAHKCLVQYTANP